MRQMLIVETRDAADHRGPAEVASLARSMANAGVPATIFLAENAAFNARAGNACPLEEAIASGVQVRVDALALRERGIDANSLRAGIEVDQVDLVVDHLADGSWVIWR